MKSWYLWIFICCLNAHPLIAQEFKGFKSIGLRLTWEKMTAKQDTVTQREFDGLIGSVNFAYFLNNNWQIGGSFGAWRSKGKFVAFQPKYIYKSYSGELFAKRFYWFSKNTAFFMKPLIAYTQANSDEHLLYTNVDIMQQVNRSRVALGCTVGFSWVINQKFVIDIETLFSDLGYSMKHVKQSGSLNGLQTEENFKQTKTDFSLVGSIYGLGNFSVGFKYLF